MAKDILKITSVLVNNFNAYIRKNSLKHNTKKINVKEKFSDPEKTAMLFKIERKLYDLKNNSCQWHYTGVITQLWQQDKHEFIYSMIENVQLMPTSTRIFWRQNKSTNICWDSKNLDKVRHRILSSKASSYYSRGIF